MKHSESAGHRAALLIDLDNIAITSRGAMEPEEVERLLGNMLATVGASDWKIAVAPKRTIRRYGPTLARLGIRWQIVPCTPDAADAEIVEIARDLSARGFDDFTVTIADGYFGLS